MSIFCLNAERTDGLGEYSSTWNTSYQDFGNFSTSLPLIQKSSDALYLVSSLKLSTIEIDASPVFGYVLHGSVGKSRPSGGILFTPAVDSIIFDGCEI
jgi:hypothetical protein